MQVKRKRYNSASDDGASSEDVRSRRSRRNSWGGYQNYRHETNNIVMKWNIFAPKVPTEEDCKSFLKGFIYKTDDMLLLCSQVQKKLLNFKEKVAKEKLEQSVVEKAFVFLHDLSNTQLKTHKLWNAEFKQWSDEWHQKFNSTLIKNEDQVHTAIQTEDPPQNDVEKRKKGKYNLSLKRTSNTQFTDDEFIEDYEETSVKPKVTGETVQFATTSRVANANEDSKTVFHDLDRSGNGCEDDDNGYRSSQETVILPNQDCNILPHCDRIRTGENDSAITYNLSSVNEKTKSSTPVQSSPINVAEAKTADKNAIPCTSSTADAQNELSINVDSTYDNDSKDGGNNNLVRTDEPTYVNKENELNETNIDNAIENEASRGNILVDTDNYFSKPAAPPSKITNETTFFEDDKDDVFTETEPEDNSPQGRKCSSKAEFMATLELAVSKEQDTLEDVNNAASPELDIENNENDCNEDLEISNIEDAGDSSEEGSAKEDLINALKIINEPDDYLFSSDEEVSSGSLDFEETYNETRQEEAVGIIINELPRLPSQQNDSAEENNDSEMEVICGTDSDDMPVNSEVNINIIPCEVRLKRIDINDTGEEPSKSPTRRNEIDELERLLNLENLEKKRKVQEATSKRKHKRQKIIKPSGSPGSKSESYESSNDSDSDSIIPSTLDMDDDDIINKLCAISPESPTKNSIDDDVIERILKAMSDIDASDEDSTSDSETNKCKKKKKRAGSTDSNKENQPVNQEKDVNVKEPTAEEQALAEKNKWKNDPLLHGKLTATDTESDESVDGDSILSEKTKQKLEWRQSKMLNRPEKSKERSISPSSPKNPKSNSNSDDPNSTDDVYKPKKTNLYPITINSDTDSDIEFISVTKKKSPLKKRRNSDCVIVAKEQDASSEIDDEDNATKKKGRRNIRAILSDETLEEETKRANLMEKQRKDRLTQKQKNMDSILSQPSLNTSQEEGLILDVDEENNRAAIIVDSQLTKRLKKHQHQGVRFMWDCCYEGMKQLQKDDGSGCILAHCMGLGKTFQVVTLIHTLFKYKATNTKHVLIVCPLSIVLNWQREFQQGLATAEEKVNINVFCVKNTHPKQKLFQVEKWRKESGVLIMGYEAYQRLVTFANPDNLTKQETNVKKVLVDPGPDLVVLDEGHLLKNGKIYRTRTLMGLKTKRRIILTGTPMQNNLKEYYYMVQFVKPNLLGSYQEYSNRFVNPITNGQYDDSTEADIAQMKRRSHVLHKLLKGTVQRFEGSVLRPYLPELYEFVLFIQLHPVQVKLYEKYIELITVGEAAFKGQLFSNFHALKMIWTHPYLLHWGAERNLLKKDSKKKNTKVADAANVDPEKEPKENEVVNLDSDVNSDPEVRSGEQIPATWWKSLCPPDFKTNIKYGPKFKIMLSIIRESERIGDKVLIFSSSITELDAIEYFLQQNETPTSKWQQNLDYYRMDGAVAPEARTKLCDSFNDTKRIRVFLVSHKVGGLGLNLVAANRVILMDVNWNPANDDQSVARIYRFGQERECYVYRLVSMGTMEEVVYERQVTKLAIASRVVDEMQISRHYKSYDLQKMYRLNFKLEEARPPLALPPDKLLAGLLQRHPEIFSYHEQQSLLKNLPDEKLNEAERELAWVEFNKENERREELEQQKKKAVGPQPGPSGIYSFLPSNLGKPATSSSDNQPLPAAQANGSNMQPLAVNHININRFLPNRMAKNNNMEPGQIFETVFVPDLHGNAIKTENTTRSRLQQARAAKESELQQRFQLWIRENPSILKVAAQQNNAAPGQATTSIPGDTLPNFEPTIPVISNVTGGVPSRASTPSAPSPIISKVIAAVLPKANTPPTPFPMIRTVSNSGKKEFKYVNQSNQVTLVKLDGKKGKNRKTVINPINVSSTAAAHSTTNEVMRNIGNIDDRNANKNDGSKNPPGSVNKEQAILLKSLKGNLNISLSAVNAKDQQSSTNLKPGTSGQLQAMVMPGVIPFLVLNKPITATRLTVQQLSNYLQTNTYRDPQSST